VLLLQVEPAAAPKMRGKLLSCHKFAVNDTARQIVVQDSAAMGRKTTGSFAFSVAGINGKATTELSYALSAQNLQPSSDKEAKQMPTTGEMRSTVTTRTSSGDPVHGAGLNTSSSVAYGYAVGDDSSEDKASGTFLLKAKVNLTRDRAETYYRCVGKHAVGCRMSLRSVEWSIGQNNSGAYNRSESNHTLIFEEANDSVESYHLSTTDIKTAAVNECLRRTIVAHAGHVASDAVRSAGVGSEDGQLCPDPQGPQPGATTLLPAGRRICGAELCGFAAHKTDDGSSTDAEPQQRAKKLCAAATIPHAATKACNGHAPLGTECTYSCAEGFLRIGRHVCQDYSTMQSAQHNSSIVFDHQYGGGRCARLCKARSGHPRECAAEADLSVRVNTTDADGVCFETTCYSQDAALRKLARGAYATWALIRDTKTGIYLGSADPAAAADAQGTDQAHIGINGVALIFECVAAEMGWQTRAQAQARITLSMSALAGELDGFKLFRQKQNGWIPTFFNRSTGDRLNERKPPVYTALDSGLNSAGVLFARSYMLNTAAKLDNASALKAGTKEIARLGKKTFNLVRFEHLLCDNGGNVSSSGTNIPFTFDDNGGCGALHPVKADGAYDFSELHYTVWLAWGRACGAAHAAGTKCKNAAIEDMWQAWQKRRTMPDLFYTPPPGDAPGGQVGANRSYALLSLWPSYIVQLPFYAAGSFSGDAQWSELFKSHWAADWAYYNTSGYYGGDDGRYGLAAGFTDAWCAAKGGGYEADMLVKTGSRTDKDGAQGCRLYSPYAVAGYLPAASDVIQRQLLALLGAGESVFELRSGLEQKGEGSDFVLLRKSMIEPGWNQNSHVSMVDFASELFGLSTIWLGKEFYTKNSNHDWTSLVQ